MKREEAIQWLEIMKEDAIFEQYDALSMAIEALSADAVMRDATAEERASVQRYIDSISTEAVQVVWCKDCVHFTGLNESKTWGRCNAHGRTVQDIDYCSWGERKEE